MDQYRQLNMADMASWLIKSVLLARPGRSVVFNKELSRGNTLEVAFTLTNARSRISGQSVYLTTRTLLYSITPTDRPINHTFV